MKEVSLLHVKPGEQTNIDIMADDSVVQLDRPVTDEPLWITSVFWRSKQNLDLQTEGKRAKAG